MLANLIVTLLIASAATLYTAHHVKRFRSIDKKTPYTFALHTTYILAAMMMWILPLLYSIAALNGSMYTSMATVRWLIGGVALALLLVSGIFYILDKRAQRQSK
jgi:hypothetical protein